MAEFFKMPHKIFGKKNYFMIAKWCVVSCRNCFFHTQQILILVLIFLVTKFEFFRFQAIRVIKKRCLIRRPPPKIFRADHHFVYFILDENNSPVFSGNLTHTMQMQFRQNQDYKSNNRIESQIQTFNLVFQMCVQINLYVSYHQPIMPIFIMKFHQCISFSCYKPLVSRLFFN